MVEGTFENGQLTPGRALNGDQRFYFFAADRLRVVRIRLLQR